MNTTSHTLRDAERPELLGEIFLAKYDSNEEENNIF